MGRSKLILLSLCSGCLLSIPWMANAGSWILLIALVPLLIVEDQLIALKRKYNGEGFFFYALTTFLTWNLLSTWWIAYVSIPGMLMIVLINALLMSGSWWLFHLIKPALGTPTAYFSLIVFWLAFEYLHFNWSMQWPWLTLGNGFAGMVEWVQWYEYTGVLGGSLWILLMNILLFSTLKYLKGNFKRQALKSAVSLFLVLALPISWSIYRYQTWHEKGNRVLVSVLQPNIDPYTDKFSGMTYKEQTQRIISLAQDVVSPSTQYVIAPETALEPLWENDTLRKQNSLHMLDTLFSRHPKMAMIVGAITQRKLRHEDIPSYAARNLEGESYEVYNSALYRDASPEIQIGHKSILVSGVEKIPFQEYFSFLGNFTVDAGGTSGSISPAAQPTIFKGEGGEGIGSVICFESAFGGFVANTVKKGANVLFVITNDGWWKESAGITQHFNYSRLRAVETRRSVARSANTGISGFINERGDVISKTGINKTTAISAFITLNSDLTFYVRHGDYLGWISVVLTMMIVLYVLYRKVVEDKAIKL